MFLFKIAIMNFPILQTYLISSFNEAYKPYFLLYELEKLDKSLRFIRLLIYNQPANNLEIKISILDY